MALSLTTIRNGVVGGFTSIYGRRLGISIIGDYVKGHGGQVLPIDDLTTTAPTTLTPGGLTRIAVSGSSQGPVQSFMPVPVAGLRKTIVNNSTSTGSYQLLSTANGASFLTCSDGTTKGVLNFIGPGGSVTLEALSTTQWAVTAQTGNTSLGNVTYTTST